VGIFFIIFGISFILSNPNIQGIIPILIGTLIIFSIIVFRKKIKKMSQRKLEEAIKESENKKWYENMEFDFGFGGFGFSFAPVIFIKLGRSIKSFFSTKKIQK
jgi:hypothetical protein